MTAPVWAAVLMLAATHVTTRPAADCSTVARLARLINQTTTVPGWPSLFGEPSHCLAFWDSTGRVFTATQLLKPAEPGPLDSGQWVFTTGSPDNVVMTLLAQPVADGILSVHISASPPQAASAIEACLPATTDEHFYGLGERFSHLDLAGQVLENWADDQSRPHTPDANTSYSPMPFLLSSRGYGLLVDTAARATFDLRTGLHNGYCVRVATGQLDFYLIPGPHPQTVIERQAQLIGRPPLPPAWAFGVWKNLIGGQARVEQDVRRLIEDEVPVDAIWVYDAVDDQESFGWPWQIYGPIAPGPYPDLPGMIQRLHGQGFKVLGYLHPFVYPGSASHAAAARQEYLVQEVDGQPYVEPWTFTPRSYVDFSNPEAVGWWQTRVSHALTDIGFDGAMLDFGEAAPVTACYANGQPGALMHNHYPMLYGKAAHMAGQAAKPGDFVFFARSGYSGSQAYTTGRFTCDQVRSWDPGRGLPSVIPAMLNGSLSGWPYWGPDIAGFFDGFAVSETETPAERAEPIHAEKELWIRWVQLGALSPTMRDMLGWQRDPVGLWTDGDTLRVFRGYARLHSALKPYLYRYAEIASRRGLPIVRPLFLNYPADPAAYTLEDEYLLGDDVLVAPVLTQGQVERRLYLPADGWRDYWTGEAYAGPAWVTVAAPLYHVPLFIRDGAALALPDPRMLFEVLDDRR